MAPSRLPVRLPLRVLALLLVYLSVPFVAGEVALRVVYRDGGARTEGGPGGRDFEHIYYDPSRKLRGPFDTGPRRPGITKVLVQGDSITWGLGVRDWRDTWPNRLQTLLNADGERYAVTVLASPGAEMDAHLDHLQNWVSRIQPDIIVYQWFVNDIEVYANRPNRERWWQQGPLSAWLREHSYLLFYLDNRLSQALPPPGRTYEQYLREDFVPGSKGWFIFERDFHCWVVRANRSAARTLVLLYPLLPREGGTRIRDIVERVKAAARPHEFVIPAWLLRRDTGFDATEAGSPWPVRESGPNGPGGLLAAGPSIELPVGLSAAIFRLRADAAETGPVEDLEVVDETANRVLASRAVTAEELAPTRTWHDLTLWFEVPNPRDVVSFRVRVQGHARVSLLSIRVPVDYHLEMIDAEPRLATFSTWVSVFDGHPNERAHAVLAEEVFKQVTAHRRGR